jgi:nucleoside-diphosphate-sugar epimerase
MNYSVLQIAEKVKKKFKKIYAIEIPIFVNNKDKQVYKEYMVSCHKLKSLLDYKIEDMVDFEIEKIINLLNNTK